MKNPPLGLSDELKATILPPPPVQHVVVAWGKEVGSEATQLAPPPDWTRYIDSRLKQFCTR